MMSTVFAYLLPVFLIPSDVCAADFLLTELVVSAPAPVSDQDVSGLSGRAARKYREQLQKQYEAEAASNQGQDTEEDPLLEEDISTDPVPVKDVNPAKQDLPSHDAVNEEFDSSSSYSSTFSSVAPPQTLTPTIKKVLIPQAEIEQEKQDELTLEQLEEYRNEANANVEEQLDQLKEGFTITSTSSLGSPLTGNQRAAILRRSVRTVGQLKLFARALAESDENLRQITLTEDSVTISYRQKARLFGILPFTYILETTVTDDGSVDPQRSWWHVIASDNVSDVKESIEDALEEESFSDNADLQDRLGAQQGILLKLSSILQSLW